MKKIELFSILAVLTIVAACNPATPTEGPVTLPTSIPEDATIPSQDGLPLAEADIPRVTVEETVAAIQNREAVIVDVRSSGGYQASHIPGALSIPLAEIERNPSAVNLDKNEWIITYCT